MYLYWELGHWHFLEDSYLAYNGILALEAIHSLVWDTNQTNSYSGEWWMSWAGKLKIKEESLIWSGIQPDSPGLCSRAIKLLGCGCVKGRVGEHHVQRPGGERGWAESKLTYFLPSLHIPSVPPRCLCLSSSFCLWCLSHHFTYPLIFLQEVYIHIPSAARSLRWIPVAFHLYPSYICFYFGV